jgi:hypothetical protein
MSFIGGDSNRTEGTCLPISWLGGKPMAMSPVNGSVFTLVANIKYVCMLLKMHALTRPQNSTVTCVYNSLFEKDVDGYFRGRRVKKFCQNNVKPTYTLIGQTGNDYVCICLD